MTRNFWKLKNSFRSLTIVQYKRELLLLLIVLIFINIGFSQKKGTVLHPEIKQGAYTTWNFKFEDLDCKVYKPDFEEDLSPKITTSASVLSNQLPGNSIFYEIEISNPESTLPKRVAGLPGKAYKISVYDEFNKSRDYYAGDYYYIWSNDDDDKFIGYIYYKPSNQKDGWKLIAEGNGIERSISLCIVHNSLVRAVSFRKISNTEFEKLELLLFLQSVSNYFVVATSKKLDELLVKYPAAQKYFKNGNHIQTFKKVFFTYYNYDRWGFHTLSVDRFISMATYGLNQMNIYTDEKAIGSVIAGLYEFNGH